MTFHPDSNLPDCMIPDGGQCCAGHAAVCEDWHKQRREIERLQEALTRLSEQAGDMVDKAAAWDACVKAREEERERCAKIAEPKGPRPCDCEYGACYCRNAGDAAAVASWDADMAVARAIRAAVSSPAEGGK